MLFLLLTYNYEKNNIYISNIYIQLIRSNDLRGGVHGPNCIGEDSRSSPIIFLYGEEGVRSSSCRVLDSYYENVAVQYTENFITTKTENII